MASPLSGKESKMAKTNKADMSCARVKQYTASDVSKAERHNERKNETYENMNVIVERIPFCKQPLFADSRAVFSGQSRPY